MTKTVEPTYELAVAVGHDAGNRSMRKAGRITWNTEDWNIAAKVFEAVYPMPAEATMED